MDLGMLAFLLQYRPEYLLKIPKNVEELRREAAHGLEVAAIGIERLNLLAPSAEIETASAIHSTCAAFAEALEFFMTINGDGFSLPASLVEMQAKIEGAMKELNQRQMPARVMKMHRAEARRRAERWRGKGTRGLDLEAPRNRLALRLLGEIEDLQSGWKDYVCGDDGLPETERESFKASLNDRVREIISLPPLTLATSGEYHTVGLKMLKDATGTGGTANFGNHPAFQRGGEFYGLVVSAKSFAGALGEAWKSVARIAAKSR